MTEKLRAIRDVEDGSIAVISGTVCALGDKLLEAPVSQRPCVYYEVRSAMAAPDEPPEKSDAQDFLVEDDTGRALVVMQRHAVTVAHREWHAVISVIDADIHEVSARLRKLKRAVRRASPQRQRELQLELNREKHLATYLCTVRAHARGRLHACDSFEEQRLFIAENTRKYEERGTTREISSRFMSTHDLVLEAGDRVQVEGHCQWQPDPDPAAMPTGYRQRAMRLLVSAPPGRTVRVEVEGAKAEIRRQKQARRARAQRIEESEERSRWVGVAIVAAIVGAVWYFL